MTPGDFGLVMPFVVCVSQDGPYEDQAFVAGYTAGLIASELEAHMGQTVTIARTVPTPLLPQLDLIAMMHGFTMTSETSDEWPEWTWVEFSVSVVADP